MEAHGAEILQEAVFEGQPQNADLPEARTLSRDLWLMEEDVSPNSFILIEFLSTEKWKSEMCSLCLTKNEIFLAPLKPGFPCRDRSSKPKSYEHHTTKP
jgi:hypothetical protein